MIETIKIIIADDHQIVIDGIRSMLENQTNYEVVADACNGQEAIDMINSKPNAYDVLITDISMSLLTGIELCKMVKSQHQEVKVIILSMYSSPAMVKESLAAEADAYVLKSAGKDTLITALYKVCNNGTYYSEEIIPLIYSQIEKEKEIIKNTEILSQREREILQLIIQEKTSIEIAELLHISKKTVDNHRAKILQKTNSKSTIGLVKYALKNGFK